MKDLIDRSGQMAAAFGACRDRREFHATAAMGIGAAGAASLLSAQPVAAAKEDEIRPFRVRSACTEFRRAGISLY
jgi:hypothetical protein